MKASASVNCSRHIHFFLYISAALGVVLRKIHLVNHPVNVDGNFLEHPSPPSFTSPFSYLSVCIGRDRGLSSPRVLQTEVRFMFTSLFLGITVS